ncbi:unnamed protein product, partial [Musa banksii]
CGHLNTPGYQRPCRALQEVAAGVAFGEVAPRRVQLRRVLLHLAQHPLEELDAAGELERPGGGVPELLLRLVEQHPEQRVVDALGADHEPLPLRPDVHREATLRWHLSLLVSLPVAPQRPAPLQCLQYQALPHRKKLL